MTKMDYTFDFLIQDLNLKYIHTHIYEKKILQNVLFRISYLSF